MNLSFLPVSETFEKERALRLEMLAKRIPFGISFLDDALGGIYPNDLIVVGARPGVGKTEFVTGLAMETILKNRRVHFFALEASEFEITRRIKYRLIANRYWNQSGVSIRAPGGINFRKWYENKLDLHLSGFEKEVEQESFLSRLHVRYKDGDFHPEDLAASILSIKDETDLIIIDHLHYIDHERSNDNQGLDFIMKTIRDVSIMANKPIVLVAHVRKSDTKNKPLMPDLDDFMGSSNISKICTRAIMIAPVTFAIDELLPTQFPTFMRVAKNRLDGSACRYTAMTTFNLEKNGYDSKYKLGKLSVDGLKFELCKEGEMPEWKS